MGMLQQTAKNEQIPGEDCELRCEQHETERQEDGLEYVDWLAPVFHVYTQYQLSPRTTKLFFMHNQNVVVHITISK